MREQSERMLALWLPEAIAHDTTGGLRWEEALTAFEQIIPGVEPLRPGLCLVRARGPARYFGSEVQAAEALISAAENLGFRKIRAGVADGRFAAEQTLYVAEQAPGMNLPASRVRIVTSENTAAFLASLPVGSAAESDLAEVLVGLGVRTLGDLVALPEAAVNERFGAAGADAHRRARGLDPRAHGRADPPAPRSRPPVVLQLDPPLDEADRLAFACRSHAEAFIRDLTVSGLVCTELRVELIDDIRVRHERQWAHPTRFTPADVVNRIRWQAATVPTDTERTGAGIAEVRLVSLRTARAAEHEPGLWNTATDQRIHHQLGRVQNLIGYEHVGTGELLGGRLSQDRQRLLPWGARPSHSEQHRPRTGPWPGQIPGPPPSTVFTDAPRVLLLDRAGEPVGIDEEDLLDSSPTLLRLSSDSRTDRTVQSWSAPWPLRERWWAGAENATRSNTRPLPPPRQPTEHSEGWAGAENATFRLQVLLTNGEAWLLRYQLSDSGAGWGWVAEGRYD